MAVDLGPREVEVEVEPPRPCRVPVEAAAPPPPTRPPRPPDVVAVRVPGAFLPLFGEEEDMAAAVFPGFPDCPELSTEASRELSCCTAKVPVTSVPVDRAACRAFVCGPECRRGSFVPLSWDVCM